MGHPSVKKLFKYLVVHVFMKYLEKLTKIILQVVTEVFVQSNWGKNVE